MNKKFILNADDFGLTENFNNAVLKGYEDGILTSASICANGDAFRHAIDEVIPKCKNLSVGIHLNIIEGKSMTCVPLLTDKDGVFNNGFIELLIKSFNKKFLEQVEQEFRMQIETVISNTKVDHIDSHVHTHAIPNIFKIAVKLCKEYKIPYIRTQFENMYFIPSVKKHLTIKYPVNIIKIILLNTFTLMNKSLVKKSGLMTNDFIAGVGYTGMMDNLSVLYALKSLKNKNCILEILIHPCLYESEKKDGHYTEYLITQNKELKNKIKELGYDLSNHSGIIFNI